MVGNPPVKLYGYNPSTQLATATGVLFAVTFLLHLVYMVRKRSWYMIAFTVGCIMEAIGYFVRRVSAKDPYSVGTFAIQSVLVILAPSLLAATHYMVFGRLMRQVGEQYSPVRASRVTKIFVTFDVVSFFIQGGGGGIQSSGDKSKADIGKWVLIGGFLMQLVSFGVFGIVAIIYHIRARRAGLPTGAWTRCLWSLYFGVTLILIRSVFRLVEFASGGFNTGYLLEHEVFYYVLEALPIFIVTCFFLLCHPTRYLENGVTSSQATDEYPMYGAKERVQSQC